MLWLYVGHLFSKPKPDKKYKINKIPFDIYNKIFTQFWEKIQIFNQFKVYLVFEICLQYYVIIFHKKQNWKKFKSKLTFTHISALRFWINNIVLKTKKLLEYAMFNQNTYSIAMRTIYKHWFVYFMIKNIALINQFGQNRHSIVQFEISSATRSVHSKTGR